MSVIDTPLYRSLRTRMIGSAAWHIIRPILRDWYVREQAGERVTAVQWNRNDLDSALIWATTPQGTAFWSSVNGIDAVLSRGLRGRATPEEIQRAREQEVEFPDVEEIAAARQRAQEERERARQAYAQEVAAHTARLEEERKKKYAVMYD